MYYYKMYSKISDEEWAVSVSAFVSSIFHAMDKISREDKKQDWIMLRWCDFLQLNNLEEKG